VRFKLSIMAALGSLPIAQLATAGDVVPWTLVERSSPDFTSPDFTWTGLYVGASAGLGSYHKDEWGSFPLRGSFNLGPLSAVPFVSAVPLASPSLWRSHERSDPVLPGLSAQGGYNYQLTPGSGLVVGVEVDVTRVRQPR
jgi:outer membrane immunogenic protein